MNHLAFAIRYLYLMMTDERIKCDLLIHASLTAGPISRHTVEAMLRNRYYLGYVTFSGVEYKGRHEPLVSQELFDRVQDVLRIMPGAGNRQRRYHHYLKGLVWCNRCNRRLIVMRGKSKTGSLYFYYVCRGRQSKACDLPYLRVTHIEAAVAEHYNTVSLPPEFEDDLQRRVPIETMVLLASLTRPVFVEVPRGRDVLEVKYRYVSVIRSTEVLAKEAISYDWWRLYKERWRQRFGLPPKLATVSLGRALTAETFHLHVRVPEGLYIDQSVVQTANGLLPRLPRDYLRKAYIGWTRPAGRSDVSVGSWRLGSVESAKNPRLLLKLMEIPPGSLGTTTLVAATVVVTAWLTGILTAAEINTAASSGTAGGTTIGTVDVAALALSLPGIASTWLGFRRRQLSGAYRSLSGVLSLAFSAVVSLLNIIFYVSRFAVSKPHLPTLALPDHKTYFLLSDWLSSALFSLAILNFGFAFGLFSMRLGRYSRVRSEPLNTPGPPRTQNGLHGV